MMRLSSLAICAAGVVLIHTSALRTQQLASSPGDLEPSAVDPRPEHALERPAPFVANVGQWRHDAAFVAEHGPTTLFLDDDGWTLVLEERRPAADGAGEETASEAHGVALRIGFTGGARGELVAEQRLPGVHHYFIGSDPNRWRSDVPLWESVRYDEVREGIDVRMRRHRAGHFEYDLLLEPGARLEDIAFEVDGADEDLRLGEDGDLVLDTEVGPVRMPAPVSWEEDRDGARRPIECRYVLLDTDRFGFAAVEARQPDRSLVVDPGIVWMTYFGGTSEDGFFECGLDGNGNLTATGWTRSDDLPTSAGAFQTIRGSVGTGIGSEDIFVSRMTPDGRTLLWSTYLGGNGEDMFSSLAVQPNGECTVTAYTSSTDFPTTPGAFQTSLAGQTDMFVTRLAADGRSLIWSTYLGTSGTDTPARIVVASSGVTTVCGQTTSTTFPGTSGGYGGGRRDAIITQVAADGSAVLWSRYVGGSDRDGFVALALDPTEQTVYGHGLTYSVNFPTTAGAFQTRYAGGRTDRFVVRLDHTTGALLASTLLGGSNEDLVSFGHIAVDGQGQVLVGGVTLSADFPVTPGAFQTTSGGDWDGFVTRMNDSLSALHWSTFLAGSGRDGIRGYHLDAQGNVTFAGQTSSSDFPTTPGAWRRSAPRGASVVGRLSPDGSTLTYSTYVGNADGGAIDVVVDAQGDAIVVGGTASAAWPATPGTLFPSAIGSIDGIAFKMSLQPFPPPTLTTITPNRIAINSTQTITLRGTSFVDVQGITVGGVAVPSASIDVVSVTQIDFTMPPISTSSNVLIGQNQPVVVTAGTGSANIGLDVTGVHPPALTAAPAALRGLFAADYSVVGDRGWASVWIFSPDLIPSTAPGVVSLGIGNNFATAFSMGSTTNDGSGISRLSVLYPVGMPPGLIVYSQVVTLDPTMPVLPFEVSNVGSTRLL